MYNELLLALLHVPSLFPYLPKEVCMELICRRMHKMIKKWKSYSVTPLHSWMGVETCPEEVRNATYVVWMLLCG